MFFSRKINKNRADQIINHLINISHGKFSMTDEEIEQISDEKLKEVFFSLKVLNEDLAFKTEELKELEEVKKQAELLEERERLKSNFLSNMSHEIRTPLNGIIGIHNLILKELKNPLQREMLSLSLKSAQDLAKVFNDLIEISQNDKGSLDIHEEVVNLTELVKNQISIFTPSATQKKIEIRYFQKEEDDFVLESDRNKLNQIISNVLGNAVKFTEEGSVVVKVKKVASESSSACYKIIIQDTGVGIPKEHHDLVFNEFHQVSEGLTKDYKGIGLGLSIAKNIVELLGGEIGLSSTNRGTMVWFTTFCKRATS